MRDGELERHRGTGGDAGNGDVRGAALERSFVQPERLGSTPFNPMVDYLTHRVIINHMVELNEPQLNTVFHALGDATRRRMLRDLAGGERTVGQLAQPFAMSLAAASKHVKVLERAGLIRRRVLGRTHFCHLDPAPLASAHRWLSLYERYWNGRLDALEQVLHAADAADPSNPQGDDQ